ncbi:MAG: HD domain-containing protein [Oscillospiraceae bacterium]|nr:HD domain-containing protein [Oscillospiraceae bacterium]
MSENNNNKSSGTHLHAISVDLMRSGMEIQEDIYASDAERLLIKGGTLLDDRKISMVKNLNKGNPTIYVSEKTYERMLGLGAQTETISRQEMEKATGYSDVKDETLGLLDEISQKKKVLQQDALHSVSERLSNKLDEVAPSKILSLVNALAPVDEYLQRHCVNVSLLNGMLGKWLGMGKEDIDRLVLIGLLHDCGKALIPPQLLNVPRKLAAGEYEVLKMHAVHSYNLLADFPEPIRMAARGHHEKVDASGYPDGLPPVKISLEARITAVSDIYDAMVSRRAYKGPQSPFGVLATLSKLKGTELDSTLVDTFVQNMPKELLEREVVMSDGKIGIVHSFDPNDIEYPVVIVGGRAIKSNKEWRCASMHTRD